MPLNEINSGLYYSDETIKTLLRSDIEHFCNEALTNESGKVTVCLHRDAEDVMYHEMLICYRNGFSYPQHLHRKSDETKLILFGEVTLFLYDEKGTLLEAMFLSAEQSNARFLARVPAGISHRLRVDSNVCAFYEVKLGPFDPEDNVF